MDRTFFVTSITHQPQTLFRGETTARLLIDTILHYRAQDNYLLHDFVIMPDHFYVLLTPAENLSLERVVQFIKGGFSFRLHASCPVWQAGFTNHRIRDEEDVLQHRGYIWMNPVRKGLARTPDAYPQSFTAGRFQLDPTPGLKLLYEEHPTPA